MKTRRRQTAATLAVGTEVTDGQITDRNSSWISNRLVLAGVDVVEHRAVPDDRGLISLALKELVSRVDLVFVTGGLGPTSDDFTRELIAEVFKTPLEFHEPSWQHIVKRFEARGAVAKPIQRQQCFFPRGSLILENPAGTANAFSMPVVYEGRSVYVVTLPGPPLEIAAIWDLHLKAKIESLIPEQDREEFYSWDTLGRGESEIAEKVEEILKGTGLRVGYRAHLPFVEVKLWVPRAEAENAKAVIDRLSEVLEYATVSRGKADLADFIVRAVEGGQNLLFIDRASRGYLQTRLQDRLAIWQKKHPEAAPKGSLTVVTSLTAADQNKNLLSAGSTDIVIELESDSAGKRWLLKVPGQQTLAIDPTSIYNFGTERGQKYAVERAFHLLSKLAPFA